MGQPTSIPWDAIILMALAIGMKTSRHWDDHPNHPNWRKGLPIWRREFILAEKIYVVRVSSCRFRRTGFGVHVSACRFRRGGFGAIVLATSNCLVRKRHIVWFGNDTSSCLETTHCRVWKQHTVVFGNDTLWERHIVLCGIDTLSSVETTQSVE